MKRFFYKSVAWLIAFIVHGMRLTCRRTFNNDPRSNPEILTSAVIYALPHAHQANAIFLHNRPRKSSVMISRSLDGDLLIPTLFLRGIRPMRGSTHKKGLNKGGREALDKSITLIQEKNYSMLLAVDGPRGPRGIVHKGVAIAAQKTGAAIIPTLVVPSRRWILPKTWDRTQIPKPFAHLDGHFGDPIYSKEGETLEELQQRVFDALSAMEKAYDPDEFVLGQKKTEEQRAKLALAEKRRDKEKDET
ncbi:DUF374 domain-containing protein [Myxococcota bacterium]|nr:DUF374 domain-containing protein [Myxococcota bacterium]